jgi:hypothetical protein
MLAATQELTQFRPSVHSTTTPSLLTMLSLSVNTSSHCQCRLHSITMWQRPCFKLNTECSTSSSSKGRPLTATSDLPDQYKLVTSIMLPPWL